MLEDFITWLNTEIEKLENVKDEDKMFILGKHFEAIRIRAQLCNMVAEENKKNAAPISDNEVIDMLHGMWVERVKERERHD